MATYVIQENGQRRELTDEEIPLHFPPQVALSTDNTKVKADGVDFATIHVQLTSLPLSDDKPINLNIAQKIILQIADATIELMTDEKGHATHEIEFSDEGEYSITAQYLNSNTLTIEAV